ncbi:MAG: hypothetical protein V3T62_07425 [Alphaproteobacteria bacterium]
MPEAGRVHRESERGVLKGVNPLLNTDDLHAFTKGVIPPEA